MLCGVDVSGTASEQTAASGPASSSVRNRKFGDMSAAWSAQDKPASPLLLQTAVYAAYLSTSAGSTGRRKAFGSQLVSTVFTQVAALVVSEQETTFARAVALARKAVTAVLATSRYFCVTAALMEVSALLSKP